ncbi:MATE family efflux transporter [Herbaspirillum sp. RTI4]|uniref:MATE family efflux transporter n=1 Tax=Herbaspirillum sp. RTI4 TaxID=3048640 RepID=UPI002AB4964A|nr:MATE family efflux transporter [Herbaspirillum sp. RTI4]MDY7578009.1 MATE family efflux transporter [Herbaspirillum sp. RTI4]MEA9982061.1 MATE family efflux transporter [Herbaspirillum sp. RTI4]
MSDLIPPPGDIARPRSTTPKLAPDLISGPIARTLLMFSLPVLGGNILQSLNASVNAIWIGHYLGEAALTAASNANTILFFLLGVVFGISMATAILVGQSVGSGNLAQARRVVGTGASFFAALSVLVALAGYVLTPTILHAMHTPANAQPYAVAYLRIIFIALPFMYFYNFLMMALRGGGDSRTPFYFMLLSVVLDIALNPLLIFGAGPIPAMGIAGSAAATLVAQTLSLGLMIAHLYRRKHFLVLRADALRFLRPDPAILRALLTKGLPMGLQMMVVSSSALIMLSMVNGYGSQITASYGITAQLWTYVQMPALAIGASVSSMAAQNVGAGRWDRVDRIALVGVAYNFLLTGALVGLLYLADHAALSLFLPATGNAIAIAQHINNVVSWSFIFFGVTMVLFGVVRATGAVMAPLLMLCVSMWLVRLPFAYFMAPRLGVESIWWSFPFGTLVALVLAVSYYRYGGWRKARMLTPQVSAAPVGAAISSS